jgi:hypothetical protein
MPINYQPDDIVEIINHTYIDTNGELKSYREYDPNPNISSKTVLRSKPFFECFMDDL